MREFEQIVLAFKHGRSAAPPLQPITNSSRVPVDDPVSSEDDVDQLTEPPSSPCV